MQTDQSPHKFFEGLRNLGIQRRESQWLGGVAAGLAARLKVDVVLIRGIAVALGLLGGLGLIAYGLAWAFLPDEQGRIHFEQALKKNWTSGMTGALVTFLLGVGPAPWAFSSIAPYVWPLLVVAAVLFIVFSRNNTKFDPGTKAGAAPRQPARGGAHAATASQEMVIHEPNAPWQDPPTVPLAEPVAEPDSPRSSPTQHFDPKESSMEPEPDYGYTRPEKPKNKVPLAPPIPGWVATIVVGVTALIIALVFCADYFDLIAFPGGSWSIALALGLLFVGLTLVVAALTHRTSGGLLGLAIPLLVLTLIFGNTGVVNGSAFGRGGGVITSNGEGEYSAVFSNSTIDLRQYENITTPTTVEISSVFSSVNLQLPADVPVKVVTEGVFLSQQGEQTQGTNANSTAPVLTVEVDGVFSRITTAQDEGSAPVTTPGF